MTLTRARTIQYIGVLLALGLLAVGYWYFAVRAGVQTNTTAGQTAGTNDPANGLAAYWTFDENTGTSTTDSSVNGATGTLTNGPSWTTGQIGYALDFDGTNDYVTTPDSDVLELTLERSRFTIAGWFNRDTFTTDDTIIAKRNGITSGDDGYIVYVDDATDQLIFEFSDGVDEYQLASTTTFTATGWNHFVVTQSPFDGNLTMYINGLSDSPTVTGNINDMEPVGNALAQRIGAESDGGNPFDGKIDEVRYYPTRAFTAEQAAELYRLASPTGVDTSLRGYWSFDGMERGDYVYDQSGAANRGTPSGSFPLAVPVAGKVGQALNFDGADDYIAMGSPANLDDIADLTVCAWARPQNSGAGTIVAKDAAATGWNFVFDGNYDHLVLYSGWSAGGGFAQWVTPTGSTPKDVWGHYCFVYNRTSTSNDPIMYVNGISVPVTENISPSGTMESDSSMDFNIGSYDNGVSNFFDGDIDEVRIYDRLFTAAEVKALYDRGTPNKTNTNATQSQGGSGLAAGLALYWPLDEGTGTNADDKGVGQNDGTLTNGPTWTTGQIGSAVDFDGTDDYIAAADPASGILDFAPPSTGGPTAGDIWSISLWFNRDTATTDDTLIAKKNSQTADTDDGYIIWIDDATDEINVRLDTNTDADQTSVSSTTAYTSAGWHHLVVVLDGDHYEGLTGTNNCPFIFVDGAYVTDAASCLNYLHYVEDTSNALAFTVGAESDGGNPFDGKLDDIRVYNRVITPDDILALYQNTITTTGIDTGLRGYWNSEGQDMNFTNGGVIYDRSGAGNWGELIGGVTKARGRVGQAFQFDGTDDYITMGDVDALDGLTTTSWSAWIKTTATTEKHFIDKSFCGGTSGDGPVDFGINFATAGKLSVYLANGSIVSGVVESVTDVNDGEWHMATFTYDGSTILIYIDGRLDKTTAWAGGALTSTSNAVEIGGNCNGHGGYFWPGQIDEARAYSRVLSAAEVKALYDRSAPDKVNTSVSTPQGTGRLDSGLAGYWKLDDGSGTSATDSSANGNTGTLTNGPTWTTGQIGSAVDFDGTNDYVTIPDSDAYAPDRISIFAWVQRSGSNMRIVSKDNGIAERDFELKIDSGNTVELAVWDQGGSPVVVNGGSTVDTSWHFIGGTWDGETIRTYLDGVEQGSGALSGSSVFNGTNPLELGRYSSGTEYFDGKIDEVRIYSRALSFEEIGQLYRLTSPTGVDTGLKGYWSFNGQDMNNTTAYDRSGTGNNGTLTNSPTPARGKLGQGLSFDGTNDYVEATGVPASLFANTTFTVSGWFKTSLADAVIASQDYCDGGWSIWVDASGTLSVLLRGNGACGSAGAERTTQTETLADGNWHHFAAVVTTNTTTAGSNTINIYIDGALDQGALTPGVAYGTGASDGVQIGIRYSANDPFNGSIDEFRIYDRALSASEVKALYSSGK